jgi:hypothetical protein
MPKTSPPDYSALYRERWLEDDVEEFLEWLTPDPAIRRQIAGYVATSISSAHSLAPGLWGLTRLDDKIRLNFGNMEALVWAPGGLFLMSDLATLDKEGTRGQVERFIWHDYGPFKTAPGSRYIKLPFGETDALASLFEIAKSAHTAHLQIASRSAINGQTRKSHYPGLLDAIGAVATAQLSQPNYVRVQRPIASAE